MFVKPNEPPTIDCEVLELLLSEGLTIAEIAERLGKARSTVAYWMETHGLEAVNRDTHGRARDVDRERLEQLVEAGRTVAEMAAELGVTTVTVRRRLARFGLRTEVTRRIMLARAAQEAGFDTITLSCPEHGDAEFVLEGRGYYRCKRCRMERVMRRRRKLKAILVADAGGSCCVCGYSRYIGALEFHHLDRSEKRVEISCGSALSLDSLRAEARKCVLLCSNCHAEVEAGVTAVPLQFRRRHPNKGPTHQSPDPG